MLLSCYNNIYMFVSGSENEADYSQEMRCGNLRLDVMDYFSLETERVNLKYGNGLPRQLEKVRQPVKLLL